jgi:hypothetical protein
VKYSCCSDRFKDKDVFKKVNLPALRVKDNGFAISNGSSKLKRLNFYECNYQYRFDTITYLQKNSIEVVTISSLSFDMNRHNNYKVTPYRGKRSV